MFIDISNSYQLINNKLNSIVQQYGFNNAIKIFIYDFYPIIHELGSVVPESKIQPQTASVEFRGTSSYIIPSGAAVAPLNVMTFEQYVAELSLYKNTLQQIYPYSIETRSERTMYENYKNVIINRFISGMVALDVSTIIDERPIFKFIPPEGSHIALNKELYYIAIKRLLPDLAISEIALDRLYNTYLEQLGIDSKTYQIVDDPNIINISLSFPDSNSMINFITSITPSLTAQEIEYLLGDYPNVNMQLQNKIMPYLNTMTTYGIRESIAIRMLLYHSSIFESMKEGLLQRAGFVMDPSYSVLFVVGENTLERLNAQSNNNIDYRALQGLL